MQRCFHRALTSFERQRKLAATTGQTLKGAVVDRFKWALAEDVFILHAENHGYLTPLAVFVEHHERFFTYFDTGVVCHPTDQNVVVFWDMTGPWYGKRRDRRLIPGPA